MNKIIPFQKDIKFNGNIGEITSIALDDTLTFKDGYTITGDLIVRGCHKENDIETDFSYSLPTGITIDNKYDTSKAKISVDDFYYEIINEDTLKVKIDLILDDLYYKESKLEPLTRDITMDEVLDIDEKEAEMLEKDEVEPTEANDDNETKETTDDKNITDLFKDTSDLKEYSVYRVYLVAPDDTLDKILAKYKVTMEELNYYNNLDDFKPGLKLIIPSVDE